MVVRKWPDTWIYWVILPSMTVLLEDLNLYILGKRVLSVYKVGTVVIA